MSTEKAHPLVVGDDAPIRTLSACIRPKSGFNVRLVEQGFSALVERDSAAIFNAIVLHASVASASPQAWPQSESISSLKAIVSAVTNVGDTAYSTSLKRASNS